MSEVSTYRPVTAARMRAAAEVLRQRAEAATPGPWRRGIPSDSVIGPVSAGAHPMDVKYYGGPVVGESMHPGNVRYLQVMAPALALALADALAAAAADQAGAEEFLGVLAQSSRHVTAWGQIVAAIEGAVSS